MEGIKILEKVDIFRGLSPTQLEALAQLSEEAKYRSSQVGFAEGAVSARNTTDKILAIIFPITAFIASGLEHCVASMYFVPMGMALKR